MSAPELYRRNGGTPVELPFEARTDDGQLRTDLANHPNVVADLGFVLAPAQPTFEDATQTVVWDEASEAWRVEDLPPVPEPEPTPPRVLGKLEFTDLAQSAGGMTDAMLVEAYKHPAFEAFWIKMQLASQVERDHPVTARALAGLEAAGFLPDGAAAVLAAWPAS